MALGVVAGLCALHIVAESWAASRFSGARQDDAGLCRWLCLGQAGNYLVLSAAAAWVASRAEAVALTMGVGVFLAAAGIFLRIASMRALGAAFHSDPLRAPGPHLIATGPYRFTRHPSELGLICIALGLIVVTGMAPILWLLAASQIGWSVARIRAEERTLRASFGEEHGRYAKGTIMY